MWAISHGSPVEEEEFAITRINSLSYDKYSACSPFWGPISNLNIVEYAVEYYQRCTKRTETCTKYLKKLEKLQKTR